jgi:lipoyl-dependent peroxiredoxin
MPQLHSAKDASARSDEKVRYTARVHTIGGRDGGRSCSNDGRLDVHLSTPGFFGTGTNPEQLLAACWSACFLTSIKAVARQMEVRLPVYLAVDAEVSLRLKNGESFLQIRIDVDLPGVDRKLAETIIDVAHEVCPYSKATRGNVDVALSVT